MGLYGPHIVWITVNFLESDWTKEAPLYTSCTTQQIETTLNYALFMGPSTVNQGNETGIAGITESEFDSKYMSFFNNTWPYGSLYRMPSYDSVWAAALALNDTLTKLQKQGRNDTCSSRIWHFILLCQISRYNWYICRFYTCNIWGRRINHNICGFILPPPSQSGP